MMRLPRALVALVPVVGLLVAGPSVAQTSGPHAAAKQKAASAAASWLALVDDGQLGASWDSSAVLLRKRIERADWVEQAERLRDSLRAVSNRTLTRARYRDSLQRASDGGPFVLLKYRSGAVEGRVEELVLTVRQDTTWKVAGYQVTPLRSASGRSAPAPSRPSNP
jgi:hypothetical protein